MTLRMRIFLRIKIKHRPLCTLIILNMTPATKYFCSLRRNLLTYTLFENEPSSTGIPYTAGFRHRHYLIAVIERNRAEEEQMYY